MVCLFRRSSFRDFWVYKGRVKSVFVFSFMVRLSWFFVRFVFIVRLWSSGFWVFLMFGVFFLSFELGKCIFFFFIFEKVV